MALVPLGEHQHQQETCAGLQHPRLIRRALLARQEMSDCATGLHHGGSHCPRGDLLGRRSLVWLCLGSSCGTYDPRASMKMKVFRILLVCFFQELLSSSSLRPISSRVEAGNAVRKRRRELREVEGARREDRTSQAATHGACLHSDFTTALKDVKFCTFCTTFAI